MSDRINTPYGAFEIGPMPSQPQVALCHGFFVHHAKRGQGFGHQLKAHQNRILRERLYDFSICTVDGANERQKAVLTRAGWHWMASFRNSKTGGHTEMWGWHVQPTAAEANTSAQADLALELEGVTA
ncbi:hypothetical protein [Ideonella livida]|uniref:N-acetyltransferase domain-containing protein n=1 Tax=Ideonella livida TaxID=2707176 RepID=A0A7C9PEX7_9BURK|nr:hypothetical protein [Ideonella livida]NDY89770.1 hypothetical protein [Ideonella livida]